MAVCYLGQLVRFSFAVMKRNRIVDTEGNDRFANHLEERIATYFE